jgi:hypothetical protein
MIAFNTSVINKFVVSVSLIVTPMVAVSQGFYNDASVFLGNVAMHVDGEIINDGTFENNGTVSFTGNWKSRGKYQGSGSVAASGDNAQKIWHYNQSIHTLIINGWGNKYVKGTLIVQGQLQLTLGIVEISALDHIQLARTASVLGGSSDSYVDGALTVEGNGYKFFPIGKNGNYAPVEFLDITGNNPQFSLEVFEDAPTVSVEDVVVRNALYWKREDIRGTFGSSRVSIDYDRRFFENPEKIILVTGTEWDEPLFPVKEVTHSAETDKITTSIPITSPIILLGEVSEKWSESDFYFSTALSPHASHAENRKVKVFGDRLSADQFHFQVFNRWGEVVYESNSLERMSVNGWDGRNLSGAELSTGAYPYRLVAVDKTGRKLEKKGVITIIH